MAAKTFADQSPNLVLVAVIAIIVISAGGLGYWFLLRDTGTAPQAVTLTPEAKQYVRHLELSDFEMKAAESYMKQTIVEIVGKISNKGDRTLALVEINCVFYDPYGQVVLRERVPIVRSRGGKGFEPGETREFRLPFDSLPQSWNQGRPQLVIARIEFK